MNALFPYAVIVGGALLATYSFATFLLEPSTGARSVAADGRTAASYAVLRETRVERWRADQEAARPKPAEQAARPADGGVPQERAAVRPSTDEAAASLPSPPASESSPSMRAAAAALTGEPTTDETARAAKAARDKAKADRARRLARERARQQRLFAQQQMQQQQQDAWGWQPQQQRGGFHQQPAGPRQDSWGWGGRW